MSELKVLKDNFSQYEFDVERDNSSSFQDSLSLRKEKKIKLKLKKQRIYKKKNHGSWELVEEIKFVEFMLNHREIFQDKQARRSHKIFRQMSKFLTSRSSEQCRSHHQKYELRFGRFDKIVAYIIEKINQVPKDFRCFNYTEALNNESPQILGKIQEWKKTQSQKMDNEKVHQWNHKLTNAQLTMMESKKNIISQQNQYIVMGRNDNKNEIVVMLDLQAFFEK